MTETLIPRETPHDYALRWCRQHHVNMQDVQHLVYDMLEMHLEELIPDSIERSQTVGELMKEQGWYEV